MATSTITVKTGGEWVKFDTLGYTFENGKEYTLQVLGSAKFGDDGKNGILIDGSEPYTFTKKSGVDLYVLTNDSAVVTVSDTLTLGLATKGGSGGGGSGEAVWGGITGTLSDQTDLADALSAKQDTLVSGTNIKTVNNESLLGSGNITISGSVPNQNTAVGATNPLLFWEGTSAEYANGSSTTWYNWQYISGGGSWTSETSGVSGQLFGVTYGNNKFIAVGFNWDNFDAIILSSSDDSTWTSETSGVSAVLYGITYGNNKFIAVGNNGTILSSSDGSTWTSETSGVSSELRSVTYGNNKFIVAGESGIILSSSDGSTWTSETSGVSGRLDGITYANNKFVVVGRSGTILTSSDGSTWTSETSGVSDDLAGVTYGDNKFIAVGNNGTILSSSDGSTWTSETSGVSSELHSVTYGDNKFIAVGNNGVILSSSDGSTWTSETSGVPVILVGVTYDNNKFITVGDSGIILSSSAGVSLSCFTTESEPTTASTVYSAPSTVSALTITAVGTGTITLSDTNTYTYNSTGNQTVTQTVGEAHPSWICLIEGVGIKKGSTTIASIAPTVDQTYNASSTNAQSGVAVASGISDTLGTIETALSEV